VAAAAVLLDLALPTLVLLAMAALSLAVRREGPGTLGLHRAPAGRLVATALAFAAVWSVFQLAVTLPVANHVSGSRQDLSAFDDLQGNVGMLALLLVLSWTLAAVGEEVAYRGFLLTRLREALGGVVGARTALVGAVLVSSVLFGLAHTEQGWIGVTVVALDGIAFAWLRLRCGTLWAAVLAHGFNNTLGFVTFFLVGPVHGLW
jgi:membrane protease YdiL (CAAX protease family)